MVRSPDAGARTGRDAARGRTDGRSVPDTDGVHEQDHLRAEAVRLIHPVPGEAAGARLFDYLKDHLVCVPVNELGRMISIGAVRLGRRTRTDVRLEPDDRIEWDGSREAALAAEERYIAPWEAPIAVVHEDADLLVVDKPAGVHVHPIGRWRDRTLLNALVHRAGARPGNPFGAWRPFPAHRLDRPASGLIAIAKSASVRDAFRRLLDDGAVVRRYRARVEGAVAGESGTIDAPIGRDPAFDYRRGIVPVEAGGQSAITHWRVISREARSTTLQCELDTGRTHQIRVHLASIGHPIEGDTLYREPPSPSQEIALRAVELAFPHPRTGERLLFRVE
jgi:23S rRNA pseudouridine1911/1915/1917 synthase